MPMKNPPHPGEIIRDLCMEPLGLTVTSAAAGLGVTRKTLSMLLNGHSGVSADMAIRFEKAGWTNAAMWLRLQSAYDLAQAMQHAAKIKVKPFPAAAASAQA